MASKEAKACVTDSDHLKRIRQKQCEASRNYRLRCKNAREKAIEKVNDIDAINKMQVIESLMRQVQTLNSTLEEMKEREKQFLLREKQAFDRE